MTKKLLLHPVHLERICWGYDKYRSTGTLNCGSSSGRTRHPAGLLGDDWYEFGGQGIDTDAPQKPDTPA